MSTQPDPPFRLRLLGSWSLHGPDDRVVRSVTSQPKRLCLLAYLALADRPVSRSTVVSVFWPESDEDRARNALSQSVHYLRRSLSRTAVESVEGDRLRVPREAVAFDARDFLDGDGAGPATGGPGWPDTVVATARLVDGGVDFFEGWNADDTLPLQDWLDGIRLRVRERAKAVLDDDAALGPSAATRSDGDDVHRRVEDATAAVDGPTHTRSVSSRVSARRAPWLIGGAVTMAVLAVLWLGRVGDSAPGPVPPPTDIAVLMPRVTPDTSARPIPPDAVHAELLARLIQLDGPQVYAMPFAESVLDLRRSLNALEGGDAPDLALVVRIRAVGSEVRAVAQLLGGPSHLEVLGTSARTYTLETTADAVMSLPQQIAEDIVVEFEPLLPGGASGQRPISVR